MENEFIKKQQELVDKFRKLLYDSCDSVFNSFYCDVTPFALADMDINYRSFLQDALSKEIHGSLMEANGTYSWAANYRANLLEKHREELQNTIIKDLEQKIESQKQIMDDMRKWR